MTENEYSTDWAYRIAHERHCYKCGVGDDLLYSPDVLYICRKCLRELPHDVAIRVGFGGNAFEGIVMVEPPVCM